MKDKYRIIGKIILLVLIKIVISNILIIGVDQKGINKEVLDKISAKTYDELSLLMIEEDFSYFDKCYKYDENNDVYVLEKQSTPTGSIVNTKVASTMPIKIATNNTSTPNTKLLSFLIFSFLSFR